MDHLSGGPNAALVLLTFLQADCRDPEYGKELLSLRQEIHAIQDINASSPRRDAVSPEDGDLETDGHLSGLIRASLEDLQPSVELHYRPRNRDDDGYVRVAEELREIAAQLEHNAVAQATQNLRRKISTSPLHEWKDHLSREVERAMRRGVGGLEHLAQERVILALTLTLVKGVCEQAPLLLRSLFNIALQCLSGGGGGGGGGRGR